MGNTNTGRASRSPDGGLKAVDRPKGAWRPVFLRQLAKHGNASQACQAAGVSLQMAFKARNKRPRFAEAWKNALKVARRAWIDRAEAEADRRAMEGWEEPVYQGGELVGTKQRYSDRLLVTRLQAEAPRKYSRKSESRTTTTTTLVSVQARTLLLSDPRYADLACQMAAITASSCTQDVQHLGETSPPEES